MYCTALYIAPLYCTALYIAPLHCTVHRSTALYNVHCTSVHYTVQCTVYIAPLHCTMNSVHRSTARYNVQCTSLHYTVQCIALLNPSSQIYPCDIWWRKLNNIFSVHLNDAVQSTSTVKCSKVQYSKVQYSKVQCTSAQSRTYLAAPRRSQAYVNI